MSGPLFVRPDGREKVTGFGRYTADLNLTGQAHAKFRYSESPAREHPAHRRLAGACALPGFLAVQRTKTCRTCDTA